MYEEHFGLAESPFALTSSPRLLFESESYLAAIREIDYALARHEPIIVITGAIGTGKTTLCRMIAERRDPRTMVATISSPPDNVDDLLRQVLDAFGVLTEDTSEVVKANHYGLMRTLQQFLRSLVPLDAQAIIVLDEAQHLRADLFEQVRLLFNLTPDADRQLLQIILIGQPELEELLARADLAQVTQRIARHHQLTPLRPSEVSAYISHRVSVAQSGQTAGRPPEFSQRAIRAIATLSNGVPRVINTLCDRALETAWTERGRRITTANVVAAARSLHLDVPNTIRVRVERRYGLAAVLAAVALASALVWTIRDFLIPAPSETRRGDPANEVAQFAVPAEPAAQPTAPHAAPPVSPAAAVDQRNESSTPQMAPPDRFLVVISSFQSRARATSVASEVVALGLPAFVRSAAGGQQVVAGPYTSRDAAVAAQRRLADADYADTEIAQMRSEVPSAPPVAAPVVTIGDGLLDELHARVRVLAAQPNVRELQQIRDEIVRRLEVASAADVATLRSVLDQLDSYLAEARRRQLEEDGRRLRAQIP